MNNLEKINLENKNGVAVVSSREVAMNFEKRHTEVLRAIEDKINQNAILRSDKYFIETTYKSGTGKDYKEYLMTRDGFSFLVMGFTGAKADDTNYKKDIQAMESATSQNESGIDGGTEGWYWLGSRSNYESGYCCGTRIRCVYFPSRRTMSYGCYYYGSNSSYSEYDNKTCNIRPVITLKSNIMTEIGEGYGSEEKPYKLIVN